MFRYRLVGARPVILSNAENDSNFTQMKWYLVILLPQFAWQAGQK